MRWSNEVCRESKQTHTERHRMTTREWKNIIKNNLNWFLIATSAKSRFHYSSSRRRLIFFFFCFVLIICKMCLSVCDFSSSLLFCLTQSNDRSTDDRNENVQLNSFSVDYLIDSRFIKCFAEIEKQFWKLKLWDPCLVSFSLDHSIYYMWSHVFSVYYAAECFRIQELGRRAKTPKKQITFIQLKAIDVLDGISVLLNDEQHSNSSDYLSKRRGTRDVCQQKREKNESRNGRRSRFFTRFQLCIVLGLVSCWIKRKRTKKAKTKSNEITHSSSLLGRKLREKNVMKLEPIDASN